MSKVIKAIAYARVSSKEQAEKELSIPAQLDAIRSFCKHKGWKLINEYIDAGKSAKTDERPAFQSMIAQAKRSDRAFNAIVVHKFDRFSRNRQDHVIYKSLLKKRGVYVYSVSEQTDPETPHGFLIEGILEVMSEFYNINLKKEVMKGMTENATRGFHNGGTAPYGYSLSKVIEPSGITRTIYVPGPVEEVSTVKRIFHLYVYENYGYKKIASLLNYEGTPSSTGGKWSYSSIYHILHNETYIGNRVWNKHDYSTGKKLKSRDEWIRKENTHKALISKETFDLVKERSKSRTNNSNLFAATNSPYILRGMLKCPYCGTNMVSGQSGGNTRKRRKYYICGNYQRKGKTVCKFKSFAKEKTEQIIIDALIREVSLLLIDGMLEEEMQKYNLEITQQHRMRRENASKELELIKMRIDLLENDSSISCDSGNVTSYIEQLKNDLKVMEKKNDELDQLIKSYDIDNKVIDIIKSKLSYFIFNIRNQYSDVQNSLLKGIVKSIEPNLISETMLINIVIRSPKNEDTVLLEKKIYMNMS